jgi:uncharacterized membrane protein YhiD involved in acid resistance
MFNQSAPIFHIVTWVDVVINVFLSFFLGLGVAVVYRMTQKGFRYSISLMYTLVYITMIVAFVMMIIGSDIARAFSLVGALSVIRFRTAIKDTKDTSYVFWSLASGMAAGVGYYQVALVGTVLIGILIVVVHYSRFGLVRRKEVVLKFSMKSKDNAVSVPYKDVFDIFLYKYNMLNIRTMHQGEILEMTFLVKFIDEKKISEFSSRLSAIHELDRISLIVCEDDELSENVI